MDKQDLRKQYEQETGITPCIINCDKAIGYTEWLEEMLIKYESIIENSF
jgi:hypothetical protein